MKTEKEIDLAVCNVDTFSPTKYPGMTYEEGVKEALEWVLGNVDDDEFEYAGSPI